MRAGVVDRATAAAPNGRLPRDVVVHLGLASAGAAIDNASAGGGADRGQGGQVAEPSSWTFDRGFFESVRRAARELLGAEGAASLPTPRDVDRLSWEEGRAFWARLSTLDETGSLGVELGRRLRLDEGMAALLSQAARARGTVEGALLLLRDYYRLAASTDSLDLLRRRDDEQDIWVVRPVFGPEVTFPLAEQATLGCLYTHIEGLVVDAPPLLAVHLASPVPDVRGRERIERSFRAPVYYGVEPTGLWFEGAFAEQAVEAGGSEEHEAALAAAQELVEVPDELHVEVLRWIRHGLPEAVRVEQVAARLGLPPRTLQRRLTETGTSFQALTGLARTSLAQALLARGLAVTEVAFLVGYQDSNAFSRAFRRITGQTPRTLRGRG